MYNSRHYRKKMGWQRFASFSLCRGETDLWVGVDAPSYQPEMLTQAEIFLSHIRKVLQEYIKKYPGWQKSLQPMPAAGEAPAVVKKMSQAGMKAGVGPMASVAGGIAMEVGRFLSREFQLQELIIENGGDIYLRIKEPVRISIFAGSSPLSEKIALEITPVREEVVVCTSSGTVGHSFSLGSADAFVLLGRCGYLVDALVTVYCNRVKKKKDLLPLVEKAIKEEGIDGALAIMGDTMAAAGEYRIFGLDDNFQEKGGL